MITLTLLHPVQSTPVQSWSFENDSVIQIGRAVENHVVLYSAVVSRYHVELRQSNAQWEVVNLGTNGTYLDGQRVTQAPLADGSIIRLARSGPNIQVQLMGSDAAGLDSRPTQAESPTHGTSPQPAAAAPLQPPAESQSSAQFRELGQHPWPPHPQRENQPANCQHQRAETDALVCIDCGQPLHVLRTIDHYQLLKPLGQKEQSFIAWRAGHVVVLKTLGLSSGSTQTESLRAQAEALCKISHPGMPKIYEAFEWQGKFFLVSEMIYGQNLKQLVMRQGPLPETQVAMWAIDICHLLNYLHQQASLALHQSLNPTNLIKPTIPHGLSQVVLVNFGALSDGAELGSAAYTAPEQQAGQPVPASALYSLGAIMVYLLTQQAPDAFYRLGNQEAHLSVADIPNLSPGMAQVIGQLTAPDPANRYSAESAASALQALA
ncbi:Serine/threonine-protein kinase B [Acaryochloris thomasi RCC1774]|uniref:non-specific serine/threonine protein kinase n=1 Tax=Acaryochloris thomasi RCC1774 TaxID=1764569 RepID=A0A2W1JMQ1_9CYAN|nr:serine/threonine-protein kinase [Acaryochloris thomasi]PZD74559.1 Serine/threonine-protein kinase B [Acaryochloris thomasi RCC1774]